ncbi:MAG TPA: anhydro-N-acetylmuramic acid kinase [Xanthobacteraceae bacterium]|nr:anhydro-N-acetylmuramic acid kinase [Xanthobacteraceae bacterium]
MTLRALGLMSGTSLDGVDVALIETDGERVAAFGPVGYRRYAEDERALLRRALADAAGLSDRAARPGALADAEALVTKAHAEAVEDLLAAHRIGRRDIAVVGFHGQTVLHRPERRLTVQIGDGYGLARRIGVPVVFDLRAADVAAGGQGAPLVPVFHRALVATLDRPHPVAVLNIGGVANVTYVGDAGELIACDTGPGNALIDDFMAARSGAAWDRDGVAAAQGRADEQWIAAALAHPFFAAPPPKSLDRNAFAGLDASALSVADGAATLTALTAAAVAAVVPRLPRPPRSWIIAGGGARNPTLMRMLAERLAPAAVETGQAVGWASDAVEAQAFAFLAVRALKRLPITFPTTTGAPRPMTGGATARP